MIFNGKKIKLEIIGGSHDPKITLKINGIPENQEILENEIKKEIERRKPSLFFNTPRHEEDKYTIIQGIKDNKTESKETIVEFLNKKQNSSTYTKHNGFLRPGQADYANLLLNKKTIPGSGELSGRTTLPMCFVGSVSKQILNKKYNTIIKSRILSVGNLKDALLTDENINDLLNIEDDKFPTLNKKFKEQSFSLLKKAKEEKDSLGGVIETVVFNAKPGIGKPLFDGLDNYISRLIFSIPGVKGVEFGDGFEISNKKGSEVIDAYFADPKNTIKTKENHNGGICAGVSNGMPIIIRTAIKPTPTIGKPVTSYNYLEKTEQTVAVEGEHDTFIANRAIPAIEGMIALAILDLDDEENI